MKYYSYEALSSTPRMFDIGTNLYNYVNYTVHTTKWKDGQKIRKVLKVFKILYLILSFHIVLFASNVLSSLLLSGFLTYVERQQERGVLKHVRKTRNH